MTMLLATLAFVSLSAAQASDTGTAAYMPNAGELTASNRDGPQGENNTEGVDANGERRICRRITATRTHQYRRVCMTARQWREFDDQNG